MLLSDWIALIACIVFVVLLTLGVLSRHRWVTALSFTIAAVVFILHVGHARLEFLWAYLLPHPAVIVVKMLAGWGAAIAILLGLARHVKRPGERRALYIISGLTGLLCVWIFANQLGNTAIRAEPCWYQHTMIQSSNNSCMAAAVCTYLRTLGVDMSEQDAAALGLIGRYGGSETQAWRALKLGLPAERFSVHIARLPHAQVRNSGHWYIAATQLTAWLGHGVAFRVDPGGETVTVRDPLEGERTESWDQFRRKWWGVCVWAEPVGSIAMKEGGMPCN